jgi:hypothetical protein
MLFVFSTWDGIAAKPERVDQGVVRGRGRNREPPTMINQNAEGKFGGAMFLYAATPDFGSEVIKNYRALHERIGTKAFAKGSPMVPLINIEEANSEDVIRSIGEKLLAVFDKAYGVTWNKAVQMTNMMAIIAAQKNVLYETPKPRLFVYQYCRFLDSRRAGQNAISVEQASD